MIVDDDELVVEFMTMVLSFKIPGIDIMTAKNGIDALEKIAKASSEPRVMLVDYAMPAMNGSMLCDAVKSKFPATVVAMMTAREDVPPCNVDAFFKKPFNLDDITAFIQNHLR